MKLHGSGLPPNYATTPRTERGWGKGFKALALIPLLRPLRFPISQQYSPACVLSLKFLVG